MIMLKFGNSQNPRVSLINQLPTYSGVTEFNERNWEN